MDSAQSPTVEKFIQQIVSPLSWESIFEWPPDVFAATSALLKRTGAYRHVVSPPDQHPWPPGRTPSLHEWNTWTAEAAKVWNAWIAREPRRRGSMPEAVRQVQKAIEGAWRTVSVEALAGVKSASPEAVRLLCESILTLHSLADTACQGFGTPTSPDGNVELQFLADHMLAVRGSLSRLAQAKGRVLPKMRTSQTGLTLRSLSLYVTWQETEVDVAWRSVPWVQPQENTLNVLIVPWPYHIEPHCFKPCEHPDGQRTNGPDRYFTYDPRTKFNPNLVIGAIDACRSRGKVHLLVLPELALSHDELMRLKQVLSAQLEPDAVPIVIAGVRDWRDSDEVGAQCNCVVISALFAGRWYDLRQDKHHRWRLDRRQVRQYNIGGTLASDRAWWEHIEVKRRTLSVLAPTGWLALCPLICEDLAQMEPLAEVLRGVGPTLVVALLLDGPQVPERWSARYASVLADDPGTSVLTVTAFGMVRRSIRDGQLAPSDDQASRTVGLWRDKINGFRPLVLEAEGRADDVGLLLTLAAEWQEEFTADGRRDHGSASCFAISGVHRVKASEVTVPSEEDKRLVGVSDNWRGFAQDRDLLELTTLCQVVDSSLDASRDEWSRIMSAAQDPGAKGAGVAARRLQPFLGERSYRADEVKFSDAYLRRLLEHSSIASSQQDGAASSRPARAPRDLLQRWTRIVQVVEGELNNGASERDLGVGLTLDDDQRTRVKVVVLNTVLWAIANRLEKHRARGVLTTDGAKLRREVQRLLGTNWIKGGDFAIPADGSGPA